VYDNGNHVSGGRLGGGPVSGLTNHVADDFLIAAGATITDVHWKGFYGDSSIPAVDDFQILIYADNGSGLPTPLGTELLSAPAGSLTRALTGETNSIGDLVFEYSAVIPAFVAAPGTTYWLEIFDGISDARWFWSGVPGGTDATTAFGSTWFVHTITFEHTFQLTDDFATGAVPEASTLAVWSVLGSLGLFAAKRKLVR
jgi:hypothetical protein